MVEENQREDDGKGNQEGELLVDRHAREGVEEKEARHGHDHDGNPASMSR